ncbi:fic/DOC family protein [Camillea tinctor]|nr:fic/DOC family protein [Camillea tinctor]
MLKAFNNVTAICRRMPLPFQSFDGIRSLTVDSRATRMAFLKEIYKPFAKIQKNSPEYMELARSGKVWEDYFHPSDSQRLGYKALQQKHKDWLAQIDRFRDLTKPRIADLAKTLVPEYAHQSVLIENNPLGLGDARVISELLDKELFAHVDIASIATGKLAQLDLPQLHPGTKDGSAVNELKTHIVASRWIAETAPALSGTAGMNETEVRQLAAMTVKGMALEEVFANCGKVPLEEYRNLPVQVRGNPLRVLPYPEEVPACMERFYNWRNREHANKEIHPLILSCHMTAYFAHIHPFLDGNGRTSRLIMQDYMMRQGYLPIVMLNFDRNDYLRMISDAWDGNPGEFVAAVLKTQLDELRTLYFRERDGGWCGGD